MNERVKRTLGTLRLYRPVRLLMHWRLNKSVLAENTRLLAFYEQFVRPGDLVFDVGANIGRRSEIFARLGARVVAVEPNPECAWQVEAMFPASQVKVERVGVGAAPGKATMRLCSNDHMSSLSEEWIQRVGTAQLAGYRWDRSIEITVETLDQLIARHGDPSFVKIDTEGFEVQVLTGLTRPVRALSFEFNPEVLESAVQSVGLVQRLGQYEFNIAVGETLDFLSADWLEGAGVVELLRTKPVVRQHHYGDVYARLRN